MTTPDPFAEDDAAYVLGALSDSERAAFEEHLLTCDDCAARVREISDLPDLLAGISMASLLAPDEPVPDTLLPGLLKRAAAERRRRNWLITGLGGLAAACVLALVVLVWPSSGSAAPKQVALSPVIASPVHASAALVAKHWGTKIELTCRYEEATPSGADYWLVVVDKQNKSHPAGSWSLVPGGQPMDFEGDTSVPRDQIAKIEITLPNGTPILQLTT